jgi:hypothetical protein
LEILKTCEKLFTPASYECDPSLPLAFLLLTLIFQMFLVGGIINHSQGASDSGKDVSDSGQDVSDSGGGNEVSWIISKFFYICEIK